MADILVVDDESMMRRIVREVLAELGHTVEEAGDGREALEVLRRRRFDLVVCDMKMPVMDGLETLREMRRDSGLSGTKVIMFTGEGMMSDAGSALSAGAVDYIVKPVDMDVLREKVARHLASAPKPSGLFGQIRRLLP